MTRKQNTVSTKIMDADIREQTRICHGIARTAQFGGDRKAYQASPLRAAVTLVGRKADGQAIHGRAWAKARTTFMTVVQAARADAFGKGWATHDTPAALLALAEGATVVNAEPTTRVAATPTKGKAKRSAKGKAQDTAMAEAAERAASAAQPTTGVDALAKLANLPADKLDKLMLLVELLG